MCILHSTLRDATTQIVIETGTMIWLNSIYNVDLSSFNYNTGFTTDLHAIAQDIIDSHDSNYKQ